MSVYEMAKMYYPRLWSEERLLSLVNAGKLAESQYKELVNRERS